MHTNLAETKVGRCAPSVAGELEYNFRAKFVARAALS